MNKYLTALLLAVIFTAMLLVLFFQMNASDEDIPPRADAPVNSFVSASVLAPVAGTVSAPPDLAEDPPVSGEPALMPAEDSAPAEPPPGRSEPGRDADPPPASTAQARRPAAGAPSSTATNAASPEWSGSITDMSLHFRNPGMYLRIAGDRPLQARYFILSQPDRLVVDLPGRWQGIKTPAIPGNNLVKSIRIGRQGNADRLVLDMFAPLKKHELNRLSDSQVEVYFH
ncbi:MAG: AMIN domain-containing protein [Deltaproteobacteria bacterium]|jgi:hypothetical protein|nr:AMIN domain-containing protein [Deltaproteobacteria bacterium]